MGARMSQGTVYIITQDQRYVDLLFTSAASLKRVMPDLMRANRLKEVIRERGIRNTLAKVFAAK
jgi:hypothetical protein